MGLEQHTDEFLDADTNRTAEQTPDLEHKTDLFRSEFLEYQKDLENNPQKERIDMRFDARKQALQDNNVPAATEALIDLKTRGFIYPEFQKYIAITLGSVMVTTPAGSRSLSTYVYNSHTVDDLASQPPLIQQACIVFLSLYGYYQTDSELTIDPTLILAGCNHYQTYINERGRYTKQYITHTETHDRTFVYPTVTELVDQYTALSNQSVAGLDGRISIANQSPSVQHLKSLTTPVATLSEIIADTPENTNALGFLYLYLRTTAQRGLLTHLDRFQDIFLPTATVQASKKGATAGLPLLYEENSSSALSRPTQRTPDQKALLLQHLNTYIANNNETIAGPDRKLQKAERDVRLLIAAADAHETDPTTIDQGLADGVEQQLEVLEQEMGKASPEVQNGFYSLVETYIQSYLFRHSQSHAQFLRALSLIPETVPYTPKGSLDTTSTASLKRTLLRNFFMLEPDFGKTDTFISEKNTTLQSNQEVNVVSPLAVGATYKERKTTYLNPTMLSDALAMSKSTSGYAELLNIHSSLMTHIQANESFEGSTTPLNDIAFRTAPEGPNELALRPRHRMFFVKTEEEKNETMLPSQLSRYNKRLPHYQQYAKLHAQYEKSTDVSPRKHLSPEETMLIKQNEVAAYEDPRGIMMREINMNIGGKMIDAYEKATTEQQKATIKKDIIAFCKRIQGNQLISKGADLRDFSTLYLLTNYLKSEAVQAHFIIDKSKIKEPTKKDESQALAEAFSDIDTKKFLTMKVTDIAAYIEGKHHGYAAMLGSILPFNSLDIGGKKIKELDLIQQATFLSIVAFFDKLYYAGKPSLEHIGTIMKERLSMITVELFAGSMEKAITIDTKSKLSSEDKELMQLYAMASEYYNPNPADNIATAANVKGFFGNGKPAGKSGAKSGGGRFSKTNNKKVDTRLDLFNPLEYGGGKVGSKDRWKDFFRSKNAFKRYIRGSVVVWPATEALDEILGPLSKNFGFFADLLYGINWLINKIIQIENLPVTAIIRLIIGVSEGKRKSEKQKEKEEDKNNAIAEISGEVSLENIKSTFSLISLEGQFSVTETVKNDAREPDARWLSRVDKAFPKLSESGTTLPVKGDVSIGFNLDKMKDSPDTFIPDTASKTLYIKFPAPYIRVGVSSIGNESGKKTSLLGSHKENLTGAALGRAQRHVRELAAYNSMGTATKLTVNNGGTKETPPAGSESMTMIEAAKESLRKRFIEMYTKAGFPDIIIEFDEGIDAENSTQFIREGKGDNVYPKAVSAHSGGETPTILKN